MHDVLGLLEAGDACLATLPEPDTRPTNGRILSGPEVIQAAQRAALARGYKPPTEARDHTCVSCHPVGRISNWNCIRLEANAIIGPE